MSGVGWHGYRNSILIALTVAAIREVIMESKLEIKNMDYMVLRL